MGLDRDKLQMVIDRMEDVDADTLADAAEIAEQDGVFLTRFANLAKQELRRRMDAMQVTELPTSDVLVKIDPPKRDYQWDNVAVGNVPDELLPASDKQLVATFLMARRTKVRPMIRNGLSNFTRLGK